GTEEYFLHPKYADIRIKFLKRPNNITKGANSCRNIGIDNIKGDFVAFLDSDDEWLPWRLERAVNFLIKNHALAIYSGAVILNANVKSRRESRPMEPYETAFDFLLANNSFAQTSTLVVNSGTLKNIKFDE